VRAHAVCMLLLILFIPARCMLAQTQADANTATTFCDFDDNQEISVRYNNAEMSSKDEPRNGKVWTPGGSPLTLFTNTTLTLNNSSIPPGAYSVYIIPNKKEWTLIVNRNVTAGAAYDEKQDVARSPMDLGEVDSPPRQLQVSFAHTSAKQCSIRLYYGKIGAFTDFQEK
jgi:Protein of unknown function (DUF2911)